ncbi:MAG: cyclic pyranopterin monophosphate synthase MoaC [Acidobacteria bacterium]|nr:cyclic pyranopterin monophosphate synthase MoaC [Acidobacteriota bacterium]
MGRSKADLVLGDKTFLRRVIDAAKPVFDEIVVVDREPREVDDVRVLVEPFHEGAAPIFALQAALDDAEEIRNWILAVDYPLIDSAVLGMLADRYEASYAEMFLPTWGGKPQFLCGGWARTLWKPISNHIRDREYALHSLLDTGRAELIEEDELRMMVRGNPFRNVNTPEDYELLKKELEPEAREEKILSHLDEEGGVSMVDVGEKATTKRRAVAECHVRMSRETLELVRTRALPKGDVLTTARIAGIFAAKKTPDLIPLTHPLSIDTISIDFELDEQRDRISIRAEVRCSGRTGVEIEAMTACSIAALTIYDMCKSAEKGIVIEQVRLIEKSGGKSGTWKAE